MDNKYCIELTDSPAPEDVQAVREGLDAYNAAQGAVVDWVPLMLFVRDKRGAVVGGLTGGTYWGWLYIGRLWIEEGLRGQGYGGKVLEEAEQEALGRGCAVTMSTSTPRIFKRCHFIRSEDIPCMVNWRICRWGTNGILCRRNWNWGVAHLAHHYANQRELKAQKEEQLWTR